MAAGLSQSAVAVGDVAGVVWLYDLRHAAVHSARLPCGHPDPVTQISWTDFRLSGAPKAHTPTRVSARSMVTAPPAAKAAGTPPMPRPPVAAVTLTQHAVPDAAKPAAQPPHVAREPPQQPQESGMAPAERNKQPAAATPPPALSAPLSPLTGMSPSAVGSAGLTIPSFDLSPASQPQADSSPVGQPAQRPAQAVNGSAAREGAPNSVRICEEQMQELKRHIHAEVAAAARQQHPPPPQQQAPATPALHMQQLKTHIDAAVAAAVVELKAASKAQFEEHEWTQVKQFGLVDDAVCDSQQQVVRQLSDMMAEIQQIRQQIDNDAVLRNRLGNC